MPGPSVDSNAGYHTRHLQVDGAGNPSPVQLKTASINLSSTNTVVAAVASKRIKVYAIKLNVSADLSVKWRDGGSTDLEGFQAYPAKGGYVEVVAPPHFLLATSAGNGLDLVISGAGTVAGRVSYWDEDSV